MPVTSSLATVGHGGRSTIHEADEPILVPSAAHSSWCSARVISALALAFVLGEQQLGGRGRVCVDLPMSATRGPHPRLLLLLLLLLATRIRRCVATL